MTVKQVLFLLDWGFS